LTQIVLAHIFAHNSGLTPVPHALSTLSRTGEIEPVSAGKVKQPQDKSALKAD